jgi:ankyrin repeat protein
VRDNHGNTLLHLAVLRCRLQNQNNELKNKCSASESLKILEILFSYADKIDPFAVNDDGQTPLHLFHGISKSFPVGSTMPMKFQSVQKSKSLIAGHKNYVDSYLSLAYPDAEDADRNGTIDITDKTGSTALHLAVMKKCSHCIQKLLKYGASMNIKLDNIISKHLFLIFFLDTKYETD